MSGLRKLCRNSFAPKIGSSGAEFFLSLITHPRCATFVPNFRFDIEKFKKFQSICLGGLQKRYYGDVFLLPCANGQKVEKNCGPGFH